MSWQSPPHIDQQVFNSDNEPGVITALLDNDLVPISLDDDIISNWNVNFSSLFHAPSLFHAIVDWQNGNITCEPLSNISPFDNSSPTPASPSTNNDAPNVLYNWDWVIPFVESQRVVLNPNHPDFDYYEEQAADTIGTVINVDNIINVINSWEPTAINLSVYIDVEWDCGHTNCYQINSLLPVTPVITNDSFNKTFHIGEKITFSPSYHFNDYIRRELNNNFNAYVVNVNPRTVDVMFEANANKLFTFNKAILNTDNTEPIKKITKYRLNDSDTFYTIDGITNPYLDLLIIKRSFTVASAKVLN